MRFLTFALAGSGGRDLPTCKEDQLKCSGGIPSGAVFVCRKGRWEVLVVCGTGMSCITDPVPACTWAKAITGFEISGELVGADIEEKGTTAPSPLTDNLVYAPSPFMLDLELTVHRTTILPRLRSLEMILTARTTTSALRASGTTIIARQR